MKKNQIFIIGLFSIGLLISSGFTLNLVSGFNSFQDGIDVDNFTSVSIAIPANTTIEIGNTYSLSIDADEKTMDKIRVEVKNGNLRITKKKNAKDIKGEVRIHIIAPDFDALSMSGSGNLRAEKEFSVDEIALKIAGSGDMSFFDLKADEVDIKISGSGDVDLSGKGSRELGISIAGSGDINAVDFEVGEVNVKISGSGDCKVHVNKELMVSISGSGSVRYNGDPAVNISISGSGSVSKIKQ